MSFLNVEITVPLWVLLLIIPGLIPLFFQILGWLKSKGILTKADIVIDTRMKSIAPAKTAEASKKPKRINEVNILKLLLRSGDQGMLLQSIADTLSIDSNAAKRALEYLEGKKLIEVINGVSGSKFVLTERGKSYCSLKGYNKAA